MEMTETDRDSGLDDKRFLDLIKGQMGTSKEKGPWSFIYALWSISVSLIIVLLKGKISVNTKSKGNNGLYKKLVMYEDKKGDMEVTLDSTDPEEGMDNQQLHS